ncbi:hypothetical protein HAX54_052622, partial [Datura stramonium]|nr:hypothetical protein [Datura stramonium]
LQLTRTHMGTKSTVKMNIANMILIMVKAGKVTVRRILMKNLKNVTLLTRRLSVMRTPKTSWKG